MQNDLLQKRHIMKYSIIALLLSISILGACSVTDPDYTTQYDSLKNISILGTIAKANEFRDTYPDIKTHITPTEIVFEFPDGKKFTKSIADTLMYVAIAPYVTTTHTCSTHYPSSCNAELKQKTFKVEAEESGNKIFEGNLTSLKNGFFEIWLPRNKNVNIKIEYGDLKGEETIGTMDNSRTCITTIKLK